MVKPLAKTWKAGADTSRAYPYSDIGVEIRLRFVDFDNAIGLGSETDPHRRFFRTRARLWYEHRFNPATRVVAGLANESFTFLECESCDSEFGEIIFESLYLEWIRLSGHPMGLRIGRQDLFYGDGLLVCEGGPLDGSRTIYVNGAALTSSIPLWSFDILAAYNPRTDEYLPRINNQYRNLIEHYEFLAGLMARRMDPDGSNAGYTLEPYYFYKREMDDPRNASIHTVGIRLGFPIWQTRFATELAYQAGHVPETEINEDSPVEIPDLDGPQAISSYAATVKLGMDLGDPVSGNVTLGYIHLRGDERTTRNKYEGWNPVLGRWPIWSELYIYTLLMESDAHPMKQGIAFWQNLKAPYLELRIGPHRHLKFMGRYMRLGADESIFSDPQNEGSLDRGDLLVLRLSYDPLPDWSAHLHFEAFRPGGFYDPYFESTGAEGPEDATFFRIEVKKTF
ncbi:MAG: alginate export family protein [bacterium]